MTKKLRDTAFILGQARAGVTDEAIAAQVGLTRSAVSYRLRKLGVRLGRRATDEQRFWKFVEKTDGCWNWKGALNGGHGQFALNNKQVRAHRFAYELLVGPIPDGFVIDHLCRNRSCVNPVHLEAVTEHTNTIRGISPPAKHFMKTHCANGHEFTHENTHRVPGGRQCRTCNRERARERRRRRKDANQARGF